MDKEREPRDDAIILRERRAAQSILSNEDLTEDLDDDAANELINLGIEFAKAAAQSTRGMSDEEADEVMSERLRTTRQLMHSVSTLATKGENLDEERRADLLNQMTDHAGKIYGRGYRAPDEESRKAFMGQYKELSKEPARMVKRVRGLLRRE